jgi:hypothetical protein
MTESDGERRDWRSEFSQTELAMLRTGVPRGIDSAQTRSARAHVAYEDPEDLHLYGSAMSRAASKDCREYLQQLDGYSERRVPRSSRVTMHLGKHLIHVQRVGARMPQNHHRVRLNHISEARRDSFNKASSTTYAPVANAVLFELADHEESKVATWDDVEEAAADLTAGSLFVAYFSSNPQAVGRIYLAPAQLSGNYLEFFDPETLHFRRTGDTTTSEVKDSSSNLRKFAAGERPRTSTRLRDE